MKKSTVAATLNFVIPGAGLWYLGRCAWGVVNLLVATATVVLAGFSPVGEHLHYVILAVAAGSTGTAHTAASCGAKRPA